jgi:hypothetical protein
MNTVYIMFPFWKSLQIRSAPSSTSIPTKQYVDNKIARIPMAMPFKSQNMTQGSTLANARHVYRKDSGGGQNWYSGSDVTYLRKITAIGKNAKTIKPWINQGAVVEPAALSTAGQDRRSQRHFPLRVKTAISRRAASRGVGRGELSLIRRRGSSAIGFRVVGGAAKFLSHLIV